MSSIKNKAISQLVRNTWPLTHWTKNNMTSFDLSFSANKVRQHQGYYVLETTYPCPSNLMFCDN
jgi:hypothetical protein